MSRQRQRPPSPMVHESVTARPLQTAIVEELTPPESPEDRQGPITVISGAQLETFPLADMPVTQARALIAHLMSIHPDAPAVVNGRPVDGDYALRPGDTLEFVHHAGEKGWEP